MRRLSFLLGLSFCVVGCGASAFAPVASAPDAHREAPNVAAEDGPRDRGTWIGAAAASDAFVPGAQNTFVAVWVDVPKVSEDAAQAPAAVALVIDTSGSMAGDKIKNARLAAQKLVDNLRDGDIVSLHTFSDAVEERVAPVALDRHSRARLASVIAELEPQGSTNLFEGVRVAGMAAMSAPPTHQVRRVVLISDGNATVGNTSTDMIGMLGEKASDHAVQITAIGVGLDYNERALNQLAIKSSGRLYHLTEPKNLPEIVSSEMALLKSTRAANARISIVPAPGVEILGVDGARSRMRDGRFEVPLGAMFGGEHHEIVVRTRIVAPESGTHPIASLRLVFDDPRDGNVERVQETVARFDVVSDPKVASARANAKAMGILAMVDASRTTMDAAVAVNEDRFDEAEKELAVTERRLRDAAKLAADETDRQRFEQSAARVSQSRKGAGEAKAAPPAKRDAMKRKAALEANDAALDFMGR